MNKNVRVRFAPSPTGPLHIGGLRTALFNYLFAKKHNGTFILRIEDTDQSRFVEGAEQYIIDALNWCNIPFNEGPYRQSERKHIYKQYAEQLIDSGNAYYAFDTTEELDFHRKDHEAKGKTFIYNWHNRLKLKNSISLSEEDVKTKLNSGDDYVIRFKSPQDETLRLKDIIRGDMTIDTNILDDKVLFKSDGMPTYHLANIVDDHLMEISHVIRGEEWLPSLALHQLLYNAFGWEAPEFAHLPLIMKPTGKGKLSKRDGDRLGFPVFPLEWKDPKTGEVSKGYREEGYFPEAVINFLAFLGWNPGTEQEIFTLKELIADFDLERVHKAGARFNPDKAKWYNQYYIMYVKTIEELTDLFIPTIQKRTNYIIINNDKSTKYKKIRQEYIDRSNYENIDLGYVARVIWSIRAKASYIDDFWSLSDFFFEPPNSYDKKAVKKQWKEDTPNLMKAFIAFINHFDFDDTSTWLDYEIEKWLEIKGVHFGKLALPLRLCLVGSLKGPFVNKIIEILGEKETIRRIEKAINTIKN
ncbi:MAG: glutamate--tRNA ligase [Bacteroidetes bacterium]|nr:glutamate--tRNA ligase [Bacteroidota bacterium]